MSSTTVSASSDRTPLRLCKRIESSRPAATAQQIANQTHGLASKSVLLALPLRGQYGV